MEERNRNKIGSESDIQQYWNKGGLVLCTEGSAEIRINGRLFSLSYGDVFVVTPLIQLSDFSPSPDFKKIDLVSDLKAFYSIFRVIAKTGLPIKVKDIPCWRVSDDEFHFIITQNERIIERRQQASATPSTEERTVLIHLCYLIMQETMLEIVSNHLRRSPASIDTKGNHSSLAYRFILHVHENYKTERSVRWYASLANMSTGHFSSLIREATGLSPSNWISTITTSYAKLMLEQTEMSVKEIANELNFPEQFTFRKYFKRNTGMAPTEYRNLSK